MKKAFYYLKLKIKVTLRNIFNPNIVNLHGVKINTDSKNISKNIRGFIYNEGYEKDEVNILKKILKPNDVVMEIGAGIGFLSSYCAKRNGNEKVFAYEANPLLIDDIKKTYALNKVSPKLFNIILKDKEGYTDFYVNNEFWSSSEINKSANDKKIKVKTKNINEEIKSIKPTILIIDIEGGEKDLLPQINFQSVNKVIVELHPKVIGEEISLELVKHIKNKGFQIDKLILKNNVYLFTKKVNLL